jgi:hypothetical protein
MWTPVALCAAAVLTPPIVVLVLFRLAALKRADDLKVSPDADEWASCSELKSPK